MKQYHLSKTVLQKAQITHCKISYSKGAARSQEALRILRNSSPEVPWKGKAEFLLGFCLRMKLSSDPERYRAAIIAISMHWVSIESLGKDLAEWPAWCETLVQNQHLEEGGEEKEERVEEDELVHQNRRKSRWLPITLTYDTWGKAGRHMEESCRRSEVEQKIRPAVVEQSGSNRRWCYSRHNSLNGVNILNSVQ